MSPAPEDRVLPTVLSFNPGRIADPIWMEYILERTEGESREQAVAIALETTAAVFRAYADGAARTAQLFGSRPQG
jgi:hypothetical protein